MCIYITIKSGESTLHMNVYVGGELYTWRSLHACYTYKNSSLKINNSTIP